MSGSAKNLQRDGIWIQPKTADELTWSNASAINAATYSANAKTTLHSDKAQAFTRAAMTIAADEVELIGVYFAAPPDDNIPFRVHADMVIVGQSGTLNNGVIVVGYGPASPTGTNDAIDEPYIIPFDQNRFDDVIMLPALDSGDGNYGRPVFFGVGTVSSQAVSGLYCVAHISVQNLGVNPPTMHFMVP